jgi:hypothetical protein
VNDWKINPNKILCHLTGFIGVCDLTFSIVFCLPEDRLVRKGNMLESWDSVVSVTTRLRTGRSRVRILAAARCFCAKCPGELWGPPGLIFSAHRRSFPRVKPLTRGVDHLHLASGLRMSGAVALLLPYAFLTWTPTLPLLKIVELKQFLYAAFVYFDGRLLNGVWEVQGRYEWV